MMSPIIRPTKKEVTRALETEAGAPSDLGTEIQRFNAFTLAKVLELEIAKAQANDLTHLRLQMNLVDAAALAAFLLRGTRRGA